MSGERVPSDHQALVQLRKNTVNRLSSPKDFTATLARDVKEGLSQQNSQRWLHPKYRYDDEGSRLVEEITLTPEYYLARAETDILQQNVKQIMELARPEELVELGSGSSTKTKILIEAMRSVGCQRYVPFDISEAALREAVRTLEEEYNWLEINGVVGDYDSDIPKLQSKNRRIIAFFGGSIGSYVYDKRILFFEAIRGIMKDGDFLLLGVDILRNAKEHLRTYMDPGHLNNSFNFRQFAVINRELSANFLVDDFDCLYHWDEENKAVVSLLQAQRNIDVCIKAISMNISFAKGEVIQVGISCKFSQEQILRELTVAGLKVLRWFTNNSQQYAVLLASL